MKLLFFWIKIFFKRLWNLIRSAPKLFAMVTALMVFFAVLHSAGIIHVGISIDETRFVVLLAALIAVTAAGTGASSLQAELFRLCNSRFSNRDLLRGIVVIRSLRSTLPVLAVTLLYAVGLIRVTPTKPVLTDTEMVQLPALFSVFGSRYSPFAVCVYGLVINFGMAVLLHYLRYEVSSRFRARRVSSRVRRPLPRLKSLIADYVTPEYAVLYLFLLFAAGYLVFDFLRAEGANDASNAITAFPSQGLIKNYALAFLILGSIPFLGIIDRVHNINWKFRAFFNLRFAAYFRRSAFFLSAVSLPLWLPFWVLCMVRSPTAALLIPPFLAVILLFTINFALSMINQLLKAMLCCGFLCFAGYSYYAQPLLGLILLIPAALVLIRGRENIHDWGSYDYLLRP